MAIKLDSLKVDLAREREGAWVVIPDLPGVRLKVRGNGYSPFQVAIGQLEQKWARTYGREPVPPEVMFRENGKVYAEHILLGWEGFDEEYSPEKALQSLIDPEMRALHDHIRYAMLRVSNVNPEFDDEDRAKNSAAPSAGI